MIWLQISSGVEVTKALVKECRVVEATAIIAILLKISDALLVTLQNSLAARFQVPLRV
jgi:hypothetical protein